MSRSRTKSRAVTLSRRAKWIANTVRSNAAAVTTAAITPSNPRRAVNSPSVTISAAAKTRRSRNRKYRSRW
jgi:hypothetical protein